MLEPIVKHVAALAERLEVARPIVGWVMIEVRCRQHHMGGADQRLTRGIGNIKGGWSPQGASLAAAPAALLLVPPAAIAKMVDDLPVWTAAAFTAPLGALEADHRRELRPVDGVEPTKLGADRHQTFPCCDRAAGKYE